MHYEGTDSHKATQLHRAPRTHANQLKEAPDRKRRMRKDERGGERERSGRSIRQQRNVISMNLNKSALSLSRLCRCGKTVGIKQGRLTVSGHKHTLLFFCMQMLYVQNTQMNAVVKMCSILNRSLLTEQCVPQCNALNLTKLTEKSISITIFKDTRKI